MISSVPDNTCLKYSVYSKIGATGVIGTQWRQAQGGRRARSSNEAEDLPHYRADTFFPQAHYSNDSRRWRPKK